VRAVAEYRCRVAYRKGGRLRFLSHLEIVHSLERAIRRAQLPYAVTQGFSPHMKIAFGPALPVGTGGEREYLDVYLTRYDDPDEVLARLVSASPEDLVPVAAQYVGAKEPALTAVATIAVYEVKIEGPDVTEQEVQTAVDAVMSAGELVVEHKGKQKIFDLARSVPKEPRARSTSQGVVVDLTVRMGQHGSLRPEALLSEALRRASLPGTVTAVTRADNLIETEEGVWTRPA